MADIQVVHRGVMRKALASWLNGKISTAKAVFSYLPADLREQAPLVAVTSAPTDRQRDTPTAYENKFGLVVRNCAIYSIASENLWTPDLAEDQIDQMEWELAVAMLNVNKGDRSTSRPWRNIKRNGTSQMDFPIIGGVRYFMEYIPFIVEVDDGP